MTSELRPALTVWADALEAFDMIYGGTDAHELAAAAVIEADREAVRAEQAAEIERVTLRLAECSAAGSTMRQTIEELHAEREKFKALAETLAGALEAAAYALHTISESNPDCMGWEPPYPSTVSTVSVEAKAATTALRQYKETRDAS